MARPTYTRLHTPYLEGGVYAYGWGALVQDGQIKLLTHNGSNEFWFADIRVFPETGLVLLTATNDAHDEDASKNACRDVRNAFIEQFNPLGD